MTPVPSRRSWGGLDRPDDPDHDARAGLNVAVPRCDCPHCSNIRRVARNRQLRRLIQGATRVGWLR